MLYGSAARAGREIGISQPAISRLLSDLEYQAGYNLFDRRRGRLVPTVEAEFLYQETHSFMASYDHVIQSLSKLKIDGSGRLRVLGTSAIAHGLLPKAIALFSADHPDVSISLGIAFRSDIRRWLSDQQFDIALAALPIDYPVENIHKLGALKGVCVLPPGHPLSAHSKIFSAQLADENYIAMGIGTIARDNVDRAFAEAGVERRSHIAMQTSASICELVLTGQGVSVVDPLTAARFRDRGLVIRPFEPEVEFQYVCVLPIQRARSELLPKFIKCIEKAFSDF